MLHGAGGLKWGGWSYFWGVVLLFCGISEIGCPYCCPLFHIKSEWIHADRSAPIRNKVCKLVCRKLLRIQQKKHIAHRISLKQNSRKT